MDMSFQSSKVWRKLLKGTRPALIIETGEDIKDIERFLTKYNFKKYLFSNKKSKFFEIKNNYPLNTYFCRIII